jgi:hypothetical protein
MSVWADALTQFTQPQESNFASRGAKADRQTSIWRERYVKYRYYEGLRSA